MNGQHYIISILVINCLTLAYIEFRQYKALCSKIPDAAKRFTNETEYKKSVAYNKCKLLYGTITGFISLAKEICTIIYISLFYDIYLSKYSNSNTLMIVLFLVYNTLTDLPFSYFFDFVIEEKFGFNKKTNSIFIKDTILSLALTVSLSYPIVSAVIHIIKSFKNFYLYLWVFICLVQFCIVILYPIFIAPLYNKFKLLEEGSLKDKINELASKINFKASQILVMDGSKRSGHSNAYFTGFGKAKKIVFYDTILSQLSENEIIAVLSHEFGHWACSHSYILITVSFTISFIFLFLMNFMISTGNPNVPISLKMIEFTYFSNSMMLPLNLFQNFIVRCLERQADRFSVKLGYGKDLQSALIKISQENKSVLINDCVYSTLHFSHPPLLERLDLIEKELNQKSKKDD